MSLFRKVIVSAALLAAQNTYAADYSLDASTMAVGATAGENLIVTEGCLDPTKTTCTATEKVRWLTAPLTKVGSLEVVGTLQGSFEVAITADLSEYKNYGIAILTADGKTINLDFVKRGFFEADFYSTGDLGTGRTQGYDTGWVGGSAFNSAKIIVQNGTALGFINGRQHGKVVFDGNIKFERARISGIGNGDRLSEVKVNGLQSATSCPSTTTPSTTSTTSNSGTCTASYSSTTGALIVPCVAVPVTSPFGGVTQTLNYSVQLQQRTGSFAFDLDLNKVKQK